MSMDTREISRVRTGGTQVTRTQEGEKGGPERIAALRRIVAEGQYAKVDGLMVDLFSASAIVKVYDAISLINRERFHCFDIRKMADIAFRTIRAAEKGA